ncbi:hypothetical protein MBLNU459_g4029t2 [Dothideomycetes sp. NU459]
MDFLHDAVALPGSAGHSRRSDDAATGSGARPSVSSVRLPESLWKFLRHPSSLIGTTAGKATDGCDPTEPGGPESDNEWQKQVLRLKVKQATSYSEWLSAASELDRVEGNEVWKDEDECAEYDTELVRARLAHFETARINCDAGRMLFLIRTSLTRNLGGMGDLRLYKHCRVGTKALIERYNEAALDTLEALVDLSSPKKEVRIDVKEVYEQLLRARQAFGRSALLLSGGGTLGMNHIGVVKSLFEAQLLPRIISGASAGSIVAAVLCTKTNDEIPEVIKDFCYGDLAVFEREGEEEGVYKKAVRFLTQGALFDISNLIRVMRDLLGDMTFQEAYNRTRRILNIGVSTASLYELPTLLNYVTAPNVMIWSAVATSCSVPFIFSPAQLLAKDPRTGKEVPWDQSPQRWIDGSVDNDLPMSRLAEMFNVNHFIVSQVNPHVVPFLQKEESDVTAAAQHSTSAFAAGPKWLRTMANLARDEALHRMHVLSELGILPTTMSKVRSVLSQRYSGDITILPEVSYTQFPNVLRNPTVEFMVQAMLSGERATWPRLSQVRNHCAIELALDDAVQRMRTRLVFSPSQVDLRMNTFANPKAVNLSGPGKRRQVRRASQGSGNGDKETALRGRGTRFYEKQRGASTMLHLPNLKVPGSDLDSGSSGLDTALSSYIDDSDEFLSDSSMESPPSPQPDNWPLPRRIVSSVSQPATPSIDTKMYLSPAVPSPMLAMTSTPAAEEPSDPEARYKKLYDEFCHDNKVAECPSLDGDVSAPRSTARRKRSLSTGMRGMMPPGRR